MTAEEIVPSGLRTIFQTLSLAFHVPAISGGNGVLVTERPVEQPGQPKVDKSIHVNTRVITAFGFIVAVSVACLSFKKTKSILAAKAQICK
jgi:hypothetical protein